MKFLKFLLGFICGAWTLIIGVAAYLIGIGTGAALSEERPSRRPNYSVYGNRD